MNFNDKINQFIELLIETKITHETEKKAWFGFIVNTSKYFGEGPVEEVMDNIAGRVIENSAQFSPKWIKGYFRNSVIRQKRDMERGTPPIQKAFTPIPYCDTLDINNLKYIISSIKFGGELPEPFSVFSETELSEELDFLDRILEEWTYAANSILKTRPERQHQLFTQYNNYRKTLHWEKDLKEHKSRISKISR